jgi:RluA family pseudouridine synthase
VILLARSAEAHRHLNTQFQENRVKKVYHTLVQGNPSWESITLKDPLLPDGDRRHRTIIDPERGKPAITHFSVLQHFDGHCLLEARPQTGRTHQIRAHLNHFGFPIIGDSLYGDASHPSHNLLSRLALHAHSLTFTHPLSEETMQYEAPYHVDFANAL